MRSVSFIERELERLARCGLLRPPADASFRRRVEEVAARLGRPFLDISSNDYLGYARSGFSRETLSALASLPAGAGASRLIHGTHAAQDELEQALADWTAQPAALLFPTGYAANSGTLAALAGPDDLIVSDALNHASLIDGCRLSKATTRVIPHRDLDALRLALRDTPARHRWVVTESCFSMDGDAPDLPALRQICTDYDASLIIDEAHALGLYGPSGSGLCAHHRVRPDVLIGTLGKALGLQGAFVATSPLLRTWLWNKARPFVFSTGFSPLLARLLLLNLARARSADSVRHTLFHAAATVTDHLRHAGLHLPPTAGGPLFPLLLPTNAAALNAARALADTGILAQAIRPPTVPPGTARLRVTLTATLPPEHLPYLVTALVTACHASSS